MSLMMKHLIVNSYGIFLGLTSQRVVVKENGAIIKEVALNRVKTIQVLSGGVSLSSNLVESCGARGIKIFFNTFNSFSALHTVYEHKSVVVRQKQFENSVNKIGLELARKLILGKIKNQRATLLYSSRAIVSGEKDLALEKMEKLMYQLKSKKDLSKEFILGMEGNFANLYFDFLSKNSLLPESFLKRTKQNSQEMTNIALNYGYAILFNFIYKSVVNAGLEPYFGVLHSVRSSKPSLVLDIIEEYRSFVVDRNIIKLRSKISNAKKFDSIKKDIATAILNTLSKKYLYNHRKITLESIIQRQVYRISGYLTENKKYKPYIFRW